jgi:hypothetical protein
MSGKYQAQLNKPHITAFTRSRTGHIGGRALVFQRFQRTTKVLFASLYFVKTNRPSPIRMSSSHQLERRAALALNNMGISLMERSCSVQGVETFKDATLVMLSASVASCQGQSTRQATVNQMIERANQSLCNPEIVPSTTLPNVILHDLSMDLDRKTGAGAELNCPFIRIETMEDDYLTFELTLAIVIYNRAVACLCQMGDTELEARELLTQSLMILDSLHCSSENLFLVQRIVCVKRSAIVALMHALVKLCGYNAEVGSLALMLRHLRSMNDDIVNSGIFPNTRTSAAA